ncbi:right-handed parallel beta-helix repeat-containing protein [Lentisphaera marina]|uniref:right-handed parallel beta-helix repeat-containing protein n=1 Tax=Lentisphaera marina TaxID=1111041 RepID=UPI002365614D|nr:right-handed parallel beta-helix repeat-containing protein [Lentisphaera marina]MDD7985524.1 right-handed parallel beta-helix repeat-containing protein [Lentisphaera marina]
MKNIFTVALVATALSGVIAAEARKGPDSSLIKADYTLYVSPDGKTSANGSKASPFGSLQDALVKVGKLGEDKKTGRIILRAGTYNFERSISLNKVSNLQIMACPGEEVYFSGGVKVTSENLKPVSDPQVLKRLSESSRDKVVSIDLSKFGITAKSWKKRFRGYAGWPEVFVGGKPFQLSRWPNNGYAKVGQVLDMGGMVSSRTGDKELENDNVGTFKYVENRPEVWDDSEGIYLNAYFAEKWFDEIVRVRKIDTENKTITMDSNTQYGLKGMTGGFYYAINLIEELDQPSEYVVDYKCNKLFIYLPASERKELIIPTLSAPFIKIENSKNIVIKGISFDYGKATFVDIQNSTEVVLDDCLMRFGASHAISISGGRKCGVNACELSMFGGSGVLIAGGDRKTLKTADHYVRNSTIHHFGRLNKTYNPAVRCTGVGLTAEHNHIHDAPHAAILFRGNDIHIMYNRIERVCLDTSDAGAIYCGRDWTYGGNLIHGNYIKDLGGSKKLHNQAIYMDDMSSGVTITNNISETETGFLLGGGRNLTVKGNLFINAYNRSIRFDSRGTGWALKKRPWLKKPNGIMWKRLAAVPYKEEPWKSRFPYLLTLKQDAPNEPRHNVVVDNVLVNSRKWQIDDNVTKHGTVQNNEVIKTKEDLIEIVNGVVKSKSDKTKHLDGMKIGPDIKRRTL